MSDLKNLPANFRVVSRDLMLELLEGVDSMIDDKGLPRKNLTTAEIEVLKSLILKLLTLIVNLTETKIDDRILRAVKLFL